MSKQRIRGLVAISLCALMLISAGLLAVAQYAVPRRVLAGGGAQIYGTNYGVAFTLGEAPIGRFGTSASYGACAGFWCAGFGGHVIYLPLVLRS